MDPHIPLTPLISVRDLLRRWKCGSDSSLRRAEAKGLLVPRRLAGSRAYAWQDVWEFEGGQPPEGLEDAHRADLLTAKEVSQFCPLSPARIERIAKRGGLPSRVIFGKRRFAPVEVKAWLESA